jgi:hypothetical protein
MLSWKPSAMLDGMTRNTKEKKIIRLLIEPPWQPHALFDTAKRI